MGKKSRKNSNARAKTANRNKSSMNGAVASPVVETMVDNVNAINPAMVSPESASSATSIGSDTLLQVPEKMVPEKKVLVLVSKQSTQREVATRQQTSLLVLHSNDIAFTMLDGSNPANKEHRTELFALGKPAVYPQFFVLEGNNTTYWGDFEKFQAAHDNGSLAQEIMGEPVEVNKLDVWGSNLRDHVTEDAAVLDVTQDEGEEADVVTEQVSPNAVADRAIQERSFVKEGIVDLSAPAPEEAKQKQKDCECTIL